MSLQTNNEFLIDLLVKKFLEHPDISFIYHHDAEFFHRFNAFVGACDYIAEQLINDPKIEQILTTLIDNWFLERTSSGKDRRDNT